MSNMFKKSLIVGSFLLSTLAVAATGGGGGTIVFDPTNYQKTLITAAEAIEQTRLKIQGNLTALYQYQEMARQGKAIASGDMNAIANVVGGPQLATTIAETKNLYSALSNLGGGVGDLQARYAYSMQMAQRAGITLEQYLKNQAALSQRNVKSAQIQQEANVKAITYVDSTFKSVQALEASATTNTNDTALLQLMNKQMSVLNTTNAKVLEYMTRRDMDTRQQETDKSVSTDKKAADDAANREAVKAANEALANASKADIEALKKKYK
jgi:type IV secretion system protein TrbJ